MSVPAESQFLHLLRTIVAGVAARQDFSVDTIDDLRLAVDEAGSHLLSIEDQPGQLSMRVNNDEGSVNVVLWVDSTPAEWPMSDAEDGLSWKILSGLTDEAAFVLEDGWAGIRLSKRGPGQGGAHD